jgi:hypothetical protein
VGECFSLYQVRFLEFQPGDVVDFDHRVARPARMLAVAGALLAVQVVVSAGGVAHHCSSFRAL